MYLYPSHLTTLLSQHAINNHVINTNVIQGPPVFYYLLELSSYILGVQKLPFNQQWGHEGSEDISSVPLMPTLWIFINHCYPVWVSCLFSDLLHFLLYLLLIGSCCLVYGSLHARPLPSFGGGGAGGQGREHSPTVPWVLSLSATCGVRTRKDLVQEKMFKKVFWFIIRWIETWERKGKKFYWTIHHSYSSKTTSPQCSGNVIYRH